MNQKMKNQKKINQTQLLFKPHLKIKYKTLKIQQPQKNIIITKKNTKIPQRI